MSDADRPGRLDWVAPVTILLILVLTVAAFGLSQRLKREPLLVDRVTYLAEGVTRKSPLKTVITPNGDCIRDRIVVRFRATRSDVADISVTTPDGRVIRPLARDRRLRRYREYRFVWDGRGIDGRPAPSRHYRVRVQLREGDRDLILPGKIRLRNVPPGESVCVDANNRSDGGSR